MHSSQISRKNKPEKRHFTYPHSSVPSLHKSLGFTIVELLVVIVVIGILATITIIAYTGISKKATESSVISDLDNASKKFKLHQIENNIYPSTIDCTIATSVDNICLKSSAGNQFTISTDNTVTPQTFCIISKNDSGNIKYRITQDSVPVSSGVCPLGKPTGFNATPASNSTISISWTALAGAASYSLKRSDSPSFSSAIVVASPTSIASPVYDSVSPFTRYYYWVSAIDAEGTSGAWAGPVNTAISTLSYSYTGSPQTLTIPNGINSVSIETWGAQKGGYSKGDLAVTPTQILNIYVGSTGSFLSGGYNGAETQTCNRGGGASDVRVGGTALTNRVIVAGGGGGLATYSGVGGGSSGTAGLPYVGQTGLPNGGGGGTQTAGGAGGAAGGGYGGAGQAGSLGVGGNCHANAGNSGGGGGGYYGGGGGGYYYANTGTYGHETGGGGSGYIGGVTNGQTIAGNATMPNPAGGTMTGNAGNGYVKISAVVN